MRLYLSPSNQPANKYIIVNTTEKAEMEAVAAKVKAILDKDYACETVIATLSMGIGMSERPKEAKDKSCDFYLAIHSNAAGATPPCNAAGAIGIYHPDDLKCKELMTAMVNELNAICPIKSNRSTPLINGMTGLNGGSYGEIRSPMQHGIPSALIEVNFHDNTTTAQWIINNKDAIAAAIVKALTSVFGIVKKSNTSVPAPATIEDDRLIWNFLTGKGLNAYAAAGIMGNLYAESGLKSNNLQNSYEKSLCHTDASYTAAVDNGKYMNFVRDCAGYGLAQWTYWSRKEALLTHVKAVGASIGDLTSQLNFLWKELQGYPGVMNVLKTAKTVLEATNVILTQYEKPADQSVAAQAKRAEYGQTYYDKFASKLSTPSTPPTPTVFTPYTVKVTGNPLNIRKGAGTNYAVCGAITDNGVYSIVEESTGTGANKWGKLKSGAGWISLDFTKRT